MKESVFQLILKMMLVFMKTMGLTRVTDGCPLMSWSSMSPGRGRKAYRASILKSRMSLFPTHLMYSGLTLLLVLVNLSAGCMWLVHSLHISLSQTCL